MTVLCRILSSIGRIRSNSVKIASLCDIQKRTMSDHLERTAQNFRQPGVSEAVVTAIEKISPTVKHLTLQVNNSQFSFKAGQWVDFFIPGIDVFTGFSMCSAPHMLKQHGTLQLAVQLTDYPPTAWVHEKVLCVEKVDFFIPNLQTVGGYSMSCAPSRLQIDRSLELAVKYSEHAPAHWIHEKCKVGDKIGVRVGGDQIIYDPQPGDPHKADILLLAGGIGINPLVSIIQHVAHLHDNKLCDVGKVEMLYSASSMKELIFKQIIADICQRIPDVNCQFYVTKEKITDQDQTSNKILTHRINKSTIEDALKNVDKASVRCYICGPPPMIASMETYLQELGVTKEQFHCEKWW